jgi:hypothetical protein
MAFLVWLVQFVVDTLEPGALGSALAEAGVPRPWGGR